VVKIYFPGSAARQTSFTTNINQSNESATVLKFNFQGGKNQFYFSPWDTRTLPRRLRVHRWKLIFTAVEIDFYHSKKLIFVTVEIDFYHGGKFYKF